MQHPSNNKSIIERVRQLCERDNHSPYQAHQELPRPKR